MHRLVFLQWVLRGVPAEYREDTEKPFGELTRYGDSLWNRYPPSDPKDGHVSITFSSGVHHSLEAHPSPSCLAGF